MLIVYIVFCRSDFHLIHELSQVWSNNTFATAEFKIDVLSDESKYLELIIWKKCTLSSLKYWWDLFSVLFAQQI